MSTELRISPPREVMACLQRDAARIFQLKQPPTIQLLKTLRNPYSETYQFQIQHESICQRIYLKMPHASSNESHVVKKRLETEFQIMQTLHRNSAADSTQSFTGVAQPFGYYPEHLALATFEVGSQTLRHHYRSAARRVYRGSSRKILMEEVKNAGIWLREFQQHTFQDNGSFDGEQLIDYLGIRLNRIMQMHDIEFSSAFAERLKNKIRQLSETINAKTHENSGRHNDFASHNILVENGKLWVIDFSMYDTGSSAYDPAYFWLDIEMLKADPTYCSHFLCQLQDNFLFHYGKISPNHPAFQLVRCQYCINRILTLHRKSNFPTLDTLYRRKVVASCLVWLQDFSRQSDF